MTKKVVETVGARPVSFGVAREEVKRTVDPHDSAMSELRAASFLTYDKPTTDLLKEINRKILVALAHVKDAQAGRNGR
jgi:hypothetical protein